MRKQWLFLCAAAALACAARVERAPALFPMAQVWAAPLDEQAEGPLASDGRLLFVATRDGSVRALDLTQGVLRWRVSGRPGRLAAGPNVVAVRSEDGTVRALDPQTGATRFTAATGVAGTLPVAFDGERIVVAGAGLAVLEGTDGRVLWSAPGEPKVTAAAVPAGPCLLVAEEGGVLRCRAAGTGASVWTYAAGATLHAPPVVDGEGRVMLGTASRAFVALRLEDGSRRWRWKLGADVRARPALLDEHVVFASHEAVLYALKRGGGSMAWRSTLPSRPLAPPLLLGHGLIVACYGSRPSENLLIGFDGRSGRRLGELRTPAEIQGEPLLVGDRLFMALRDLRVIALQLAAPSDPDPTPPPASPAAPRPPNP